MMNDTTNEQHRTIPVTSETKSGSPPSREPQEMEKHELTPSLDTNIVHQETAAEDVTLTDNTLTGKDVANPLRKENASGAFPPPEAAEESTPKDTALIELMKVCAQMSDNLKTLSESVPESVTRFDRIEHNIGQLSHQISYLPPQIKTFGRKIDELNTSISDSKYNNLLKSLLMIYDLVEQSLLSLENKNIATTVEDYHRTLGVLKTQLLQVLEINGLTQIPALGESYNPKVHKALKSLPVEEPDKNGKNVEVFRPGFQSGSQILRFSEVSVGRYVPPLEDNKDSAVCEPETASETQSEMTSSVNEPGTAPASESPKTSQEPPMESSGTLPDDKNNS